MRRTRTPVLSLVIAAAALGGTAMAATPAEALLTVPVQCESFPNEDETVLAWDDATYEVSGTCGVVRVTGDRVTVVMPTARRLVVEGTDVAVQSKPLVSLEVTGARAAVSATSVQHLALGGSDSTVSVVGLLEGATVTGPGSVLTAERIHTLHLASTSARVEARKVYDLAVTGDDNSGTFRRADEVILSGARNSVTVARGRTTVRDRGEGNTVRVHRRRR